MSRAVNPRNPCAFCENHSYLTVDAYTHLTSKHFFETWTAENAARLRYWIPILEKRSPDKPLDPTMKFRMVLTGYKNSIPTCIIRKRCYFKNPEYYNKGLEAITTQMWLDEANRILKRCEERYTFEELSKVMPIIEKAEPVQDAKPIPLTPDQEKFSLMEKLIEKLMKSNNDLQRQVEVQEEQLELMKKKTEDILTESQAIVSRTMNRLAKHSIEYDDIPDFAYSNTSIADIEAEIDDIDYNYQFTPVLLEKKYPALHEQIYKQDTPKPKPKPTLPDPKPTPLTAVPEPTPLTSRPRTEPIDKPAKLPPAKKVPREFRQAETIGEHRLFSPPAVDE